ncbi:hypothetical protein LZ31DRAFT_544689 [Colletotrichum somersetense]|nr:hypothetical protein LZ31DRAFT_544689 [Colletotrichum somersetense]
MASGAGKPESGVYEVPGYGVSAELRKYPGYASWPGRYLQPLRPDAEEKADRRQAGAEGKSQERKSRKAKGSHSQSHNTDRSPFSIHRACKKAANGVTEQLQGLCCVVFFGADAWQLTPSPFPTLFHSPLPSGNAPPPSTPLPSAKSSAKRSAKVIVTREPPLNRTVSISLLYMLRNSSNSVPLPPSEKGQEAKVLSTLA